MRAPFVIWLRGRWALLEPHSGGKANHLARLLRNGFPVPPGFIVTTRLHYLLFGARPAITPPSSGPDLADRLPTRIRGSIVDAFRRVGGPVSVRSSMIGEDGLTRSFAGQLRTVLNVGAEAQLFEAMRQCYASLDQVTFQRYCSATPKSGRPAPGILALLIQRMVPARAAGVAFSADPNTGVRRNLIEAAPGPGDRLVSGRVVPDRYAVDPLGTLVFAQLAAPNQPVLDEGRVRELSRLVDRIHGHAGWPQDIEWAWDGARFWVLQSRPITTLSRQHLFSNRLVSDMTPGLIKPLLWSTNIADMQENVFGRIFGSLLGQGRIDRARLVRRFHSRIYADMTLFGELLERLGLPANFFEMMIHDEASGAWPLRVTWRLTAAMARMLLFVSRYGRVRGQARRFIELHDRRLELFRSKDWSDRSADKLLSCALNLRRAHGRTQWYMWITALNMMVRRKLLSRFLRRHAPEVTSQQLLTGLAGLKSLQPNRELKLMASRARDLPPADRELLLEGEDGAIRSRLERTPSGRGLLAEFDGFMARYGFLSSNGTDFTVPPWIEHPDLIWKCIGRLMASGALGDDSDAGAIREEALGRVRSRLRFPRSWLFGRLLRSVHEYLRLRERLSLFMSEDVAHMRRLYLALGRRLVTDGRLPRPDDVFYLTFGELTAIVAGRAQGERLRKRIAIRRTTLEADAAVDPEEAFYGRPRQRCPPEERMSGTFLQGIIVSFGRAQGIARIVHDPYRIERPLSHGDILVVPHTDVGWTPLFPSIGGLVAETGGQLSHSAIIAREYGLPAVVGVRKATRIIHDGQPIAIDGDHGRVYLQPVGSEKDTAP